MKHVQEHEAPQLEWDNAPHPELRRKPNQHCLNQVTTKKNHDHKIETQLTQANYLNDEQSGCNPSS